MAKQTVTPARANAAKVRELERLFFTKTDATAPAEMVLIGVKYLFEAIEKRLDEDGSDPESTAAASYLALVGQEALASLLERHDQAQRVEEVRGRPRGD